MKGGFPSAGGKSESLLALPHTNKEVGLGAELPPVWVFAISMALAAEPLFMGRLGRFTAEVCLCTEVE